MVLNRRFLSLLLFLTGTLLFALEGEKEIKAHYPCQEGSENEFSLITYLENEFESRSIPFQTIDYSDREGIHSFSRSLRLDFNGEKEERLFIAVSLNGTSDYSYLNTALLYNLALELQTLPSTRSVTLLFLGGEKNPEPVGSTIFLEDFTDEESSSLLYIDVEGPEIKLSSSTRDYNCPLWFLRSFTFAFEQAGLVLPQQGIENLLNRAGFGKSNKILSLWMSHDIPSLLLSGSGTGNPSTSPLNGTFLEGLLYYLSSETNSMEDNREKNYLVLKFAYRSLYIGEWHSVLTIISLASLFILTVIFQSRNFTLNIRRYRSSIWVLLLIFSLVFIILYLSTLIMEEILLLKNMSDLWRYIPRNILYFKLLLTLLFSSFFLFIIRGIPIPRSPHFYSYGAILFSLGNLLLLSSRDISLTYYALWLLLCLFPFSLSRKMYIKTLLTLLIPLPALYFLTSVVLNSFPDLSRYLLMDRITGNLLITTFLMPYILMLTSLHYSRFYYHKERRSYTAWATFTLVPAAAAFILLQIILYSPYSEEQKQPYTVLDTIDYSEGKRVIKLTSSRQMGTLEIEYADLSLVLNNLGEEAFINGRLDESYLSYEGRISSFLNRKRLRLNLIPAGNPESLEIRLYTDEGQITIYDCNYPYSNRSDNKESRIIIGSNPLFPLELDLTVTLDTEAYLELIFNYSDPPLEDPEIKNKSARIDHKMVLREVLDLSADEGEYVFP
ncbi:MAG: hypothetical protein PQJ59_18430 [Spirochaetales bacterium]|nr:hypothetical protein [Spirochaetales bacterium]